MGNKESDKLRAFASNVKKDYPDANILLFGSRARNEFLENSDYDVIVISNGFKGIHFFKRIEKMYDYWAYPENLDIFCYTPQEFEEKKSRIGFVSEALRKTRPIKA